MTKKKEEPIKHDSKLILVAASQHFLNTRFRCLPFKLVTEEEFKRLKAGEEIALEEEKVKFHPNYFIEVEAN